MRSARSSAAHVRAMVTELRIQFDTFTPESDSVAVSFTAGMLAGLGAAVMILGGATAEEAMETVNEAVNDGQAEANLRMGEQP